MDLHPSIIYEFCIRDHRRTISLGKVNQDVKENHCVAPTHDCIHPKIRDAEAVICRERELLQQAKVTSGPMSLDKIHESSYKINKGPSETGKHKRSCKCDRPLHVYGLCYTRHSATLDSEIAKSKRCCHQ